MKHSLYFLLFFCLIRSNLFAMFIDFEPVPDFEYNREIDIIATDKSSSSDSEVENQEEYNQDLFPAIVQMNKWMKKKHSPSIVLQQQYDESEYLNTLENIENLFHLGGGIIAIEELFSLCENNHNYDYNYLFRILKNYKNLNNILNDLGETLLFAAVNRGSKDKVNLLLRLGVNPDIQNKKGLAPLHIAVQRPKCIEKLYDLLKYNPKINIKDKGGLTPLFYAAKITMNDAENPAIQILLDHGAYIQIIANNYQTPLLYAFDKERMNNVKLLLQNGADFFIDDLFVGDDFKKKFLHCRVIKNEHRNLIRLSTLLKKSIEPLKFKKKSKVEDQFLSWLIGHKKLWIDYLQKSPNMVSIDASNLKNCMQILLYKYINAGHELRDQLQQKVIEWELE